MTERDPGMRADDPTDEELAEEDRRRSEVTVGDLAAAHLREQAELRGLDKLRAAPTLTPMFPEDEDRDGRKRQ